MIEHSPETLEAMKRPRYHRGHYVRYINPTTLECRKCMVQFKVPEMKPGHEGHRITIALRKFDLAFNCTWDGHFLGAVRINRKAQTVAEMKPGGHDYQGRDFHGRHQKAEVSE